MNYYCTKCDNSSWQKPFEGGICDKCWEKKRRKHNEYIKHKKKYTDKRKAYYEKNKEKCLSLSKKCFERYKKENPEKLLAEWKKKRIKNRPITKTGITRAISVLERVLYKLEQQGKYENYDI